MRRLRNSINAFFSCFQQGVCFLPLAFRVLMSPPIRISLLFLLSLRIFIHIHSSRRRLPTTSLSTLTCPGTKPRLRICDILLQFVVLLLQLNKL